MDREYEPDVIMGTKDNAREPYAAPSCALVSLEPYSMICVSDVTHQSFEDDGYYGW